MYKKSIGLKIQKKLDFFEEKSVQDEHCFSMAAAQNIVGSLKEAVNIIGQHNLTLKELCQRMDQHNKIAKELLSMAQQNFNILDRLLQKHERKLQYFRETTKEEKARTSRKDNSFNSAYLVWPQAKRDVCSYLGLALDFPEQEIVSIFKVRLKKEYPDYAKENYDNDGFLKLLYYYKYWKDFLEKKN